MRRWLLALLLAGCAAPAPPPPQTAWGIPRLMAEAPTAETPALLITPAHTWLAWTQPLDGQVRHMASDGQQSRILALPAAYPMRYTLLPAAAGAAHWLWVDRTQDEDELRLQSALVGGDLVARIGPVTLSTGRTTQYAALPLADGRALVVWAQGSMGGETLHTLTLDEAGRASFITALGVSGSHPTLTQSADEDIWLYWVYEGALWRARWGGGALAQAWLVELLPPLALTERLERLHIAHDPARTYIVWQIVGASGARALLSVMEDERTSPLIAPRIGLGDVSYETGYNGGAAVEVVPGDEAVEWLRPLHGRGARVAMAAAWGGTLGVLYFEAGRLRAAQPLLPVGRLFDAPILAADRDRHLTLAWSQPFTEQAARLHLLTTR